MNNIKIIKKIKKYSDYTSITFECGLSMNTQNDCTNFIEGEAVIFQSGRNRVESRIFKNLAKKE